MRAAALIALALAGPVGAATPSETVAAFHAALLAGRSAEAGALLAPAAQIYEAGHVERSRAEYAAHHLAADAQFAAATTTRVLRQSEQVSGDLALVTRETETSGRFKGAAVNAFGTETMALQRSGDGWLIVHIHWSSRKRND